MGLDNGEILRHFQGMVQLPTVSNEDPSKMDFTVFEEFHRYLEKTFPLIHQNLEREVVGRASLLYRWRGDGSSKALPMALMAHMDVVPPGEQEKWTHPPFAAEIAGGYIWGRGTLDTKCQISAEMEAVEELLRQGYRPRCDVYLCYGHNEEIMAQGSSSGARAIVALLKKRGIRLGCVIDEGGSVISGKTMGIDRRVGVIGLAEKGSADFLLSVTDAGGHSSQPKGTTALSRVARAAVRLEEHPMRPRLLRAVGETLTALAPHMGMAGKLLERQETLWPVLQRVLAKNPATNAMIRTTIAATMSSGSAQANILPERATVTLNCRILPGDTLKTTAQHIKRVVGKDVKVTFLRGGNPSPESKTDAPFRLIKRLAGELFPDAVITSYLMLGGSDARHYYAISDHVYRFSPFYFDEQSLPTAHAIDERMPCDGFATAAQFYINLIREYPETAKEH